MAGRKKKLEETVAGIQLKHGPRAIQQGIRRPPQPEFSVSTGFPPLDALTGCDGIPLGAMSLLSGPSTSGKTTVAYKLLANAQNKIGQNPSAAAVALVDMPHTANFDYLARCGIDLDRLITVRAATNERAVHLILDLARSREVNLVVVDGLTDLFQHDATRQTLIRSLRRLPPLLRAANCGLVFIDEINPAWLVADRSNARTSLYQQVPLHLELVREAWIEGKSRIKGYRALAKVMRSRWSPVGGETYIEIIFNGTVRARKTW